MQPLLPFILYFIAALLIPIFKGKAKKSLILLIPIAAFINILLITEQKSHVFSFSGFEIILFNADRLNLFISYIFAFVTILVALFTINVKDNKHFVFMFIYAGSAMGILFSGDFLSFYLFWEVMMVAAVILISLNREKTALKAAFKYLVMHLTGGGILLAGILLQYHYSGSMEMKVLENGVPSMLILIGIGLNAAFLPVHTWLPEAYSKSPVSSALILTVFTTKIAVYSLARLYPGVEALIIMGVAMAVFGSVYALFKTDVRKILSYLIICSLGFILTAIGSGGSGGINAAFAYAWNHIIYNTLLFMCLGATLERTHKQDLNSLDGLFGYMPFMATGFMIGALSISGLPFFNGFVSKVLIFDTLYDFPIAYWLLKLASFFITLAMLRLMYHVLFAKASFKHMKEPTYVIFPVVILSFAVIAFGIFPQILTSILPFNPGIQFAYTLNEMASTLMISLAAVLLFWVARKKIKSLEDRLNDFDLIYESIFNEFQLFARDPVLVASSWIDYIHFFIRYIPARLFMLNQAKHLPNVDMHIQNAKNKRLKVSTSPAVIDFLTIGSSLLLTALVVMIFLIFMLYKKL